MQSTNSLFERLGSRPALLRLLNHFYADIRQHHLLGPIFNSHIQNWPQHIEKIADFWSQATGGPAQYTGGMPARHFPLGLREEHFQAWLALWEINCRQWLAPDSANELIALARNIGQRLRQLCAAQNTSPTNSLNQNRHAKPNLPNLLRVPNGSPSPGGEGRGEGGRSSKTTQLVDQPSPTTAKIPALHFRPIPVLKP